MSFLEKPGPRCHGKGRRPYLLLAGGHLCRKCEGTAIVATIRRRLAEAIDERLKAATLPGDEREF